MVDWQGVKKRIFIEVIAVAMVGVAIFLCLSYSESYSKNTYCRYIEALDNPMHKYSINIRPCIANTAFCLRIPMDIKRERIKREFLNVSARLHIEQIALMNYIFQKAFYLITKNKNISYEECLERLFKKDEIIKRNFHSLSQYRQDLINTALKRFFSDRDNLIEEFKDANRKYPIKEFTDKSTRLYELIKSKDKMNGLWYSLAHIRERNEIDSRKADLLRLWDGGLREYFAERLKIYKMPEYAMIEMGSLCLEVRLDPETMKKINEPYMDDKGLNGYTRNIDFNDLREIIIKYPKYLYKDFHSEILAYLFDGSLYKEEIEVLIEDYRQNYQSDLIKVIEIYKGERLEPSEQEALNNILKETWSSEEWHNLKAMSIDVKDKLDKIVLKHMVIEKKRLEEAINQGSAIRFAPEELAYFNACHFTAGLLMFENIHEISRELDTFMRVIDVCGINEDEYAKRLASAIADNVHVIDDSSYGYCINDVLYLSPEAKLEFLEHEGFHFMFNGYFGARLKELGRQDFFRELYKGLIKQERKFSMNPAMRDL